MNDSKKFCRRVALSAILLAFALPVSADEVQDANALFKQKQYDQALAKVNSALAKSPKDMKARFLKAVIYAEQGRTNDAIVVFQQIISDYPNVPEPYNNLGVLYTSLGQYKKAELQFETAIRLKPNYAIAHENLGDLRLKMASDSYGYAVDADRGNSKAKGKRDEAAALSSGQPVAKGGAPGVVPHTVAVKPEPVAPEAAAKPAPVAPAVKPEPAKPVAPAVVAKPEPVKPAPVAVAPAKPVAPATPVAAAKPAPVAPAVKPEPAKPVAPAAVAKPEPVKPAPVAVAPAKPVAPATPVAAAKPAPVTPAVKPEPAKPVAPAAVAKPEPVKAVPVAVAPAKPVAPATPVAAAKPAPVAPAVKPEPAKPVAPAAVAKPEPVKPAPVAVSPAKPAAPAKSSDDKAAIEDSVRAWASAWSAQDSGKYLSFYSKEFNVPGGMSRTAWEGQRKDRVSKPKFIKVDIAHVKVVKTDADHATVTFQQSYASSTLNETAGKTLVMVKSGSGWLIREEKSAGGAAPAVSKISVEPTLTPADMHAPVRPSRPVMPSSPTSRARSHGATLESAEPAHVQVVGPSSPVKPGGKASGSKDDAVGAVYAWANAWSARDAKRYLSFYSRDFAIPGGQSRAEWEANREERISKPSFIRVSVDEVKVSHPDASHATVVFVQTYKSNSLNQVGAKKLMMEKTAGGWQIIEEKNL